MFCKNLFQYARRKTNVVNVGSVPLGGSNPIRLQSMTNVSTTDIDAVVEQCARIARAGAAYVRCTTQGVAEAEAMQKIREKLNAKKIHIPLIADVHFNPRVAEVAAQYIEKVRINPGNYIDKRSETTTDLSDAEYNDELNLLRQKFVNLLNICKQHKTALRIGVNHGSLSERIMNRYGDTPAGMVEAAMEFLRICKEEKFDDVVVSMKSSNTRVMVQAYRLIAEKMNEEKMSYPLHLGVTEAGEGEDGRIKSAVGIGTLLADGLGDTIRVSLTEAPEKEVPVARILADYFWGRENHKPIPAVDTKKYSPYKYRRRETHVIDKIGGNNPVAVVADLSHLSPINNHDLANLGYEKTGSQWQKTQSAPDFVFAGSAMFDTHINGISMLSDESENLIRCNISLLTNEFLAWLKENPKNILLLESSNTNAVAELRACFLILENAGLKNPVIVRRIYDDENIETLQIKAACDFGALLIDGFADGICLCDDKIDAKKLVEISFAILQAARVRYSRTEYIACPSCGRTLYDIQTTLAQIKAKTAHLKHLKIAVMGCIVNGIGEMADADYGYVGAGVGKISLYKNSKIVKRNIPQEQAVDELVALIKENGDWVEA